MPRVLAASPGGDAMPLTCPICNRRVRHTVQLHEGQGFPQVCVECRDRERAMEGGQSWRPLNGMDICSGSGIGAAVFSAIGLSIARCYIEIEPYCQRILQARMRDGAIPTAPIWDDLRAFDPDGCCPITGRLWRGYVDFLYGGIPCQPWSVAGQQRGQADERDLWPCVRELVGALRPRVLLLENVPGIIRRTDGLPRIAGDLASLGYDTEWDIVSAEAVGAPHRRERVWVVAYPEHDRRRGHGDGACSQGALSERAQTQVSWPYQTRSGSTDGGARPLAHPPRRGQRVVRWAPGDAGQPDVGSEVVADTTSEHGERTLASGGGRRGPEVQAGDGSGLRDAGCERLALWQGQSGNDGAELATAIGAGWWESEPNVGRVASRVASRVDRLRAIGNGWVGRVASLVGYRIMRGLIDREAQAAAGQQTLELETSE